MILEMILSYILMENVVIVQEQIRMIRQVQFYAEILMHLGTLFLVLELLAFIVGALQGIYKKLKPPVEIKEEEKHFRRLGKNIHTFW